MRERLNLNLLIISILTFTFSLPLAFSGSPISYRAKVKVNRNLDDILQIAADIENTCERGCRYKVSNIRQGKIVKTLSSNRFFSWEYIDSGTPFVRDTKQFRYITYTLSNDRKHAKFHSSYPSRSNINALKRKTGLDHKTLFNSLNINIEFNVIGQKNGRDLVAIDYSVSLTSNSSMINSFKSKVRKELAKTAKENFYNYQER